MANTTFEFYKNVYLGIAIEDSNLYSTFSERASEELAPFSTKIPNTTDAQLLLKKCECRIADILYYDYKSIKNGQKMASESVNGYYSINYNINDFSQVEKQINNAIKLYLGKYVLKSTRNLII